MAGKLLPRLLQQHLFILKPDDRQKKNLKQSQLNSSFSLERKCTIHDPYKWTICEVEYILGKP